MPLTLVPEFSREKIYALLDLIGKAEISDITLKVHGVSSPIARIHLTPSISILAEAGYVEGLTSIEEIRELFLNRDYQLLKLEVEFAHGSEIRVDFLKHTLTQQTSSPDKRLLTANILQKKGLLGEDAIASFNDLLY